MTDIFHRRRRWWKKEVDLVDSQKRKGHRFDTVMVVMGWIEEERKERGWHRELWQSERSRDHLMTDWLPGDANNSPLRRRRKRCRPEFLKKKKTIWSTLSLSLSLSLSLLTINYLFLLSLLTLCKKKFGEKRGKSEREANICPLRDQGPSSLKFFFIFQKSPSTCVGYIKVKSQQRQWQKSSQRLTLFVSAIDLIFLFFSFSLCLFHLLLLSCTEAALNKTIKHLNR